MMNSLDRLHIELAAIDTAISDRGVAEKDCTLPLAERISNIISELKEWRHKCSVAEAENERLLALTSEFNEVSIGLDESTASLKRVLADNERLRANASGAVCDELREMLLVSKYGSIIDAVRALRAKNWRLRAVRDASKSFIDVFDQTEIDAGASDLSTRERELLDRLRAAISRLDAAAGGA